MHRPYDALIVGAGPAGSSLALRLARAGRTVALVEKRPFPRFKPCGEFQSPQCRPLLGELGLLDEVLRQGARSVAGLILHGHGRRVRAPFTAVGHRAAPRGGGLAMRREVFDLILLRGALSAGRVDLFEGWSFARLLRAADGSIAGARLRQRSGQERELRAAVTVGADGVRSRVAEQLGVTHQIAWLDKLALTTRYAGAEADPCSEVHLFDEGYFAASTVDNGHFSLNLVVDRSRPRSAGLGADELLERCIAACPSLQRKLAGAERVEPVRGSGPLAWRTERQAFDGAALVGDAAGYVDPFTGEGMFCALQGAKALADCLLELAPGETPGAAALEPYVRARRRAIVPHSRAALALQHGLRHPWLVRGAMTALQWRPRLAELVVAVTGDYLEPRSLLRPDVWWGVLAP